MPVPAVMNSRFLKSAPLPLNLNRFSFAWMNVAVYLALTFALLLAVLKMTHGHFSYCLDDPYIHLALAERLRYGFFGLNAGEPVSPSSSILWPFLLVPFVGTRLLQWAPLILNVLCSAATAWLLGAFVQRTFLPDWRGRALSLLLLAATNVFGLAYTGLEHPFEVLLCVAGAWAVLHMLDGNTVPRWTLVAVVVLPSVRYEGFLVTLGVAFALWVARARRTAIGLVIASLLPLVAFSVYLHHVHLPWFPISVLVKSSSKLQDHGMLIVRVARLLLSVGKQTLQDFERVPQFLLVVVLAWFAAQHSKNRRVQLILAGCAGVGAVQVVLGPVGWFFRYELYCLTFTLMIALDAMCRSTSSGAMPVSMSGPAGNAGGQHVVPGMLLVLTSALGMFYAQAVVNTARASTGIWQQQAQMGRFASEFYTGPVAVNDLGWVAFDRHKDEYVLDLAGLGSAEVFRTSEPQRTATWLDGITREHGVGLVMIYPDWFKVLPATWKPVAKLCAEGGHGQPGPAEMRVMFYATPLADEATLLAALKRYQRTLPADTTLRLQPANAMESCEA